MNEDSAESWSEEQIKKWEHDRWLKIQEMGNDFYKDDEDKKVDPFEEEERVRWQEEEEKAQVKYLKMIKEEEEGGYFRQTVAELIEERSAEKKLRKEMERKHEETGKDLKNDDETYMSKSNPNKEKEVDKEKMDEATSSDASALPLSASPTLRLTDSPTDSNSPILQETNLTSTQDVVETKQREFDEST